MDLILEIIKDFKNDDQEYEIVATSYCSQIDEIKKQILKLKHEFAQVLKNPTTFTKYGILEARFELKKLTSLIDEAKRNGNLQEKKTLIQLLVELQAQEDRINKILEKYEEKQICDQGE